MNFTVERLTLGDELYTDRTITNTDSTKGFIGTFTSVFGRLLDENGNFICYTMEREDTLIAPGTYKYDLYDSPKNKCKVIRLVTDPQGNDCSGREWEVHIANYAFQVTGCTVVGAEIIQSVPMLSQSALAFGKLMDLVGTCPGTVTYSNNISTFAPC